MDCDLNSVSKINSKNIIYDQYTNYKYNIISSLCYFFYPGNKEGNESNRKNRGSVMNRRVCNAHCYPANGPLAINNQ